MVEQWKEQVADLEEVGVCLQYKLDGKLFRRSTRGAGQACLTECQFADDAIVLASTRQGAEVAIRTYIDVAGLIVSLQKTKLLVTGHGRDTAPITVGEGVIECVDEFPYLGDVQLQAGCRGRQAYCQC